MFFRWLVNCNDVTAAQVAAYRDVHEVSMADAKRILQARTEPRLQISHDRENWYDVPVMVEPHPTSI